MQVPLLDLKAHHAPLRDELDVVINEVVDSGYFILTAADQDSLM